MPIRDIILTAFIYGALPFALRHPWIGVMLWTWVSVMSPHRLTWTFAFSQPFAAAIAGVTLIGFFFSKDQKHFPVTPITVLLILLLVWMTWTTLFAIEPDAAWYQWSKVGKIFLMLLVTVAVLHSRRHIELFIWITLGSVAFYGIKGGMFTIRGGGVERVYGPAGSFIEDNNALALAVILCIPLLNYVRLTVKRRWIPPLTILVMGLCALSALGSQSRGALLAIVAMGAMLWWRGKAKVLGLVVMLTMGAGLIAFMPESWERRMNTIGTYESDGSAQGRFNSWAMAMNLVKDRPIVGGGFDMYATTAFAKWAPDPLQIRSAHSIYFQVLGEHGFPGLFIYLLLGILAWRLAGWVRKHAKGEPDWEWAFWFASMSQVSMVGFMVGGAFLNLAYWDMPYNIIVGLVLTRVLMEKELVNGKVPISASSRDANGSMIRGESRSRVGEGAAQWSRGKRT